MTEHVVKAAAPLMLCAVGPKVHLSVSYVEYDIWPCA